MIKCCNDTLHIIASYLQFDDKVLLGKLCNINFLQFYDFNNNPEFKLCDNILDIFTISDGSTEGNPLSGGFICDQVYWAMRHEIIEEYIINITKIKKLEDLEDKKDTIDTIDTIDAIPYNGINADIYNFYYVYHFLNGVCLGGLTFENIFGKTVYYVRAKKIIEYIENNGVKIKYHIKINLDEIDDRLSFYISSFEKTIIDSVCDYYRNALLNDNMNYFCYRCANFGHMNESTKCIFYNKEHRTNIDDNKKTEK